MKGQIREMNEQSVEGTADNQITLKNRDKTKTLTLSYTSFDDENGIYKVELTTNEENSKTEIVAFYKKDGSLGPGQIKQLKEIFDISFDNNFLKNNSQVIKDNNKLFFGLFETLEKVLRTIKKAYETHNNNTENDNKKYDISSLEDIYFVKKNKYPKCLSLCGGLNFDYDFSLENINGDDNCYWKLDNNNLSRIYTRNENGWITENGWIDRTINWFSNLNCRECNNAEPEISNEINYYHQQSKL